jgi:hypothetical protein
MIDAVWPYLLNQVHIKDGIGGEMGNCAVGAGIGGVLDSVRELVSRGFAGYWILENEYESDADLASVDSEILSNWIAAAKQ